MPPRACRRVSVILLAFFSFVALPLTSQVLPLRYYTVRDGLVSNSVRCITQDRAGYLWIGTTEGLSVFDGTVFRNITIPDGLPNSNINWVGESPSSPGTMWVATNGGGVCRITADSVAVISLADDQVANRVNMVQEDSSGSLWCATDGGLYIVRDGKPEIFGGENPWREVVAIHRLGGDAFLVVALTSVHVLSVRSGRLEKVPIPLSDDAVLTCAMVVGRDDFWVASTRGGLFHCRSGSVVGEVSLGRAVYPLSIHRGGDGFLKVSAYDGIHEISVRGTGRPVVTRFTTDHGLQDKGITTIYTDDEKNVWFGSFANGLSVLNNANVLRFPLPIPIPQTSDASLIVDRNEHAWAVTSEGMLEIWRDPVSNWKKKVHRIGEPGGGFPLSGVAYDSIRHGIWMSSGSGGVRYFRIGTDGIGESSLSPGMVLEPGRDLPAGLLYCFTAGRGGRLYLSIFDKGVVVVDPSHAGKIVATLTEGENGLPGTDIRSLLVDRSGHLWAGGYISGVVRLENVGGKWTVIKKYSVETGLTDNSVRVLFEDRDGRMWIGTRYGGITILDGDSVSSLTVMNGLLSNAIWSITQDPAGVMWVGTQAGLQSITPGPSPRLSTVSDLTGQIVQTCRVSRDRVVWSNAYGEIVMFDAGHPPVPGPPPRIQITGIRAGSEKFRQGPEIKLSYWQSNISVDFTGITFSDPERLTYQYMLENVDREWQPPSKSRSLTFAALKPGDYRLLVKAVNAGGIQSPEPAVVRFSVGEPFWLAWWFITVVALFVAALSYGLYRNRIAALVAVERVRSRIATDLHDDIGSDLTQIAILAEVVKAKPGNPGNLEMLDKVGAMARRAIAGMSDLVWYIDPRHDRLADLIDRIRDLASGLLAGSEISLTVAPDPSTLDTELPPEIRKELLLAIKEALTNAVRHSGCGSITISLGMENRHLVVLLEDDGRGMTQHAGPDGHGLGNMRRRVEGVGGTFRIGPGAAAGTAVRMTVPVGSRPLRPTILRG